MRFAKQRLLVIFIAAAAAACGDEKENFPPGYGQHGHDDPVPADAPGYCFPCPVGLDGCWERDIPDAGTTALDAGADGGR